jgi:hypothetical protein
MSHGSVKSNGATARQPRRLAPPSARLGHNGAVGSSWYGWVLSRYSRIRSASQDGSGTLRMLLALFSVPTALAATTRRGAEHIATAEEKIAEAVTQLENLDEVKKIAGSIQKNAGKIESTCTGMNSSIQRLLADALAALTEAAPDAQDDPATDTVA